VVCGLHDYKVLIAGQIKMATTGAALAAFCFGLAGREGATFALVLGAFAAVGCVMSILHLIAIRQRGPHKPAKLNFRLFFRV